MAKLRITWRTVSAMWMRRPWTRWHDAWRIWILSPIFSNIRPNFRHDEPAAWFYHRGPWMWTWFRRAAFFCVRRIHRGAQSAWTQPGADQVRAFCEQGVSGGRIHSRRYPELPFGNGLLDSCKIDRTLQHVERPAAALNEMFRTVRSGGAVVCAEPDWGTFVIDAAEHTIAKQIAGSGVKASEIRGSGVTSESFLKRQALLIYRSRRLS